MECPTDKAASDSDSIQVDLEKVPTDIVFPRYKRKRNEKDEVTAELCNFKTEIKSLIQTQEREMKKLLNEIQQSNSNIQASVSILLSQNEEFKKKIDFLDKQVSEDKKYITLLEDKLEELQIVSRKTNFEIKNVPKKQNETKEDLIGMVTTLSSTVGSNLKTTDITDVYRVKP